MDRAYPLLRRAARLMRDDRAPSEKILGLRLQAVEAGFSGAQISPDEALRELDRLKAEIRESGLDGLLLDAIDVELHVADRAMDTQETLRALDEAAVFADSPDPRIRAKANSILCMGIEHRSPDEAIRASEKAMAAAEATDDFRTLSVAYNRRIVALVRQARGLSGECQQLIRRALDYHRHSGDVYGHYNVMANAGTAFLEGGHPDRSVAWFEKAEQILGGLPPSEHHVFLRENLGEATLDLGDFLRSRDLFAEARQFVDRTHSRMLVPAIEAGLGMTAIKLGEIRTAKSHLEPSGFRQQWPSETSLIPRFQATLMGSLGKRTTALSILEEAREAVKDIYVPAWLRLVLEEAKMRRRWGRPMDPVPLKEAIEVARKVGLSKRTQELASLLGE